MKSRLKPSGPIGLRKAAASRSLRGKQVSPGEDRTHGVELEVPEQPRKPLGATIEVQVVPKARQGACLFHPRLLGIDLPGVDVEHELLLLRVQLAQRPARESVRKEAEVPASRDG